jgi:hypothetical protein
VLGGDFSEKAKSLLEMMRAEDEKFRRALTKKEREPDSDIAYDVERTQEGVHASMGRDKSSREDFQKARLGREWARESEHAHKGYPAWHPKEIETPGVQRPKAGRGIGFFPEIKGRGFKGDG